MKRNDADGLYRVAQYIIRYPYCGAEMKMIALIDDGEVIEKILRHLGLWPEGPLPARAPPLNQSPAGTVQSRAQPILQDYVIEPFFDDLPLEGVAE